MTQFQAGERVWAKLRGYPWWPAKVMKTDDLPKSVMKQGRKGTTTYPVRYYGTGEYGWLAASYLVNYSQFYSQYSHPKVVKDNKPLSDSIAQADDKDFDFSDYFSKSSADAEESEEEEDEEEEEEEGEEDESEQEQQEAGGRRRPKRAAGDEEEPEGSDMELDEQPAKTPKGRGKVAAATAASTSKRKQQSTPATSKRVAATPSTSRSRGKAAAAAAAAAAVSNHSEGEDEDEEAPATVARGGRRRSVGSAATPAKASRGGGAQNGAASKATGRRRPGVQASSSAADELPVSDMKLDERGTPVAAAKRTSSVIAGGSDHDGNSAVDIPKKRILSGESGEPVAVRSVKQHPPVDNEEEGQESNLEDVRDNTPAAHASNASSTDDGSKIAQTPSPEHAAAARTPSDKKPKTPNETLLQYRYLLQRILLNDQKVIGDLEKANEIMKCIEEFEVTAELLQSTRVPKLMKKISTLELLSLDPGVEPHRLRERALALCNKWKEALVVELAAKEGLKVDTPTIVSVIAGTAGVSAPSPLGVEAAPNGSNLSTLSAVPSLSTETVNGATAAKPADESSATIEKPAEANASTTTTAATTTTTNNGEVSAQSPVV